MSAGRVLKSLMVKRVREEKDCGTLNREYFRSQTLLAQKPKRVGRLANAGAKVRNINETVKLFGNFLFFNNFFTWFEGCLSTVHLIKREVSHGTISPAKAAYLRESSGTGSSTLKSEPMYLSQ